MSKRTWTASSRTAWWRPRTRKTRRTRKVPSTTGARHSTVSSRSVPTRRCARVASCWFARTRRAVRSKTTTARSSTDPGSGVVDPVVRPAERDDVEQLEDLELEARAALVGQRGGDRWLETHARRGSEWADVVGRARVAVGVIDSVVVGYLVGHHERSVAYIDEVYVTPDAREVGFGDALVEVAMADARSAGCSTIEAEALPGDRDGKNLYERAGITARLIVVSKAL